MKPGEIRDPEGVSSAPLLEAIQRAKVTLLLRHAMAGVFLTRCQWVLTTKHPTAAVDGRRLWLNPAFFLALPPADRVFVLLHEALHVALGHHLRAGRRNPEPWNQACDYVVNAAIVEGGGLALPEGALFEASYLRASAEQVYADLFRSRDEATFAPEEEVPGSDCPIGAGDGGEDSEPTSPDLPRAAASKAPPSFEPLTKPSGDDPPAGGPGTAHGDVLPYRHEDGSEPTRSELERFEVEHTMLLQRVALACGRGTPALARELADRQSPTGDFRDVLLRFASEVAARGNDYSLSRRNTRYMAAIPSIVLPGCFSQSPGRVVAVVDTSGSICRAQIGCFTGALEEMLQVFSGLELTVLAADDVVHEVHEIPPGSSTFPEGLVFSGHGGTDFRPAIGWAQENADPQLLVYLTDGFGEAPEHPPAFPVLWALPESRWSRTPAPWGVVARLAA
jgi:predicted metal-dependent peptidase